MPSSTLRGSAIKVLSSGVVVKLEDEREGFLPRREFTGSGLTTRDLRQVVQVGKEFEVIPEELSADNEAEMSGRILLHLAPTDSWDRLEAECPPGSVVTGVVAGVEAYGVFVDLLPGVTGLVARVELSESSIKRVEDVVWIGDVVQCIVLSIKRAEGRVPLSIKAATSLRHEFLQNGTFPERAMSPAVAMYTAAVSVVPTAITTKHILVVDDSYALREELADHLLQQGHTVEQAASARDAQSLLEQQLFDVAVLDLGLPDQNGLSLAAQMLQRPAHPRVVLMTDWGKTIALENEIEHVTRQGADLIMKPNHGLELDQLLATYYARSGYGDRVEMKEEAQTSEGLAELNLRQALLRILSRLQRQTDAAELVIFAVSADRQHLDVLAHRGSKRRLPQRELQAHWLYSPIRDVLQDEEKVFANNVSDPREAGRFRYLLKVFDFESCIGIPVQSETKAAVFVFHPQANHFKRVHRPLVWAAAEQIAAVLDRHAMKLASMEMQRYVLLGQLGAVVVHEINNKLGAANWNAQKLPVDLRALAAQRTSTAVPADDQTLWAKVNEHVEKIVEAMNDLLKITEGFDDLVRRQEAARLNVHEVIQRAVAFSAPLAEDAQVTIRTQLNHPAPYVMGVAAWLQQGFLNTLLNAIQLIQENELHSGGLVLITTQSAPSEAKRGLQIRIHDDGPGIHTALWERIFDLGFSTRKHGAGIGLFMTRQLIQSLGGRIVVEDSHVLWGTTMLIELPLIAPPEELGETHHD